MIGNVLASLLHRLIILRRPCFFITCGLTCVFIYLSFQLHIDNRPDTLIDTQSESCEAYRTYLKRFGSDRIVLVAIRLSRTADHPAVLERLISADTALRQIPDVHATTSLMDISTVRKTTDGISRWHLVPPGNKAQPAPQMDNHLLTLLRTTYPAIKQLISEDRKIIGVLVELRTSDQGQSGSSTLADIRSSIRHAFGEDAVAVHMSGGPVLMQAIRRHNVENAFIFLVCACIVGIAVEIYIFKNLIVSIFIYGVSAVAAVWIMGIMALAGISLNPISGMAFGMVLILTTIAVIHVVTHFYEKYQRLGHKEAALAAAVAAVGRPGFMCAVTTAIGFVSIVTSSVPTVRQFGLIMSMGALLSFGLVYLLLPYLLLNSKWAAPSVFKARSDDLLTKIHNALGSSVSRHRSWYVATAVLLLVASAAGIPQIRLDTSLMHLFHPNAPEVLDYQYIQQHLAPHQRLHVLVETPPEKPLNAKSLKTIREFEGRLTALDEIQSCHSFFRVLETVYAALFEKEDVQGLYRSTFLFQQLYRRVLSDPENRRLLEDVLDFETRSICLSLEIAGPMEDQPEVVAAKILRIAEQLMQGIGRISVTGPELAAQDQARKMIHAQMISIGFALVTICTLLMLQFSSWRMGILSLIPNIFPIVAIFGVMGWFGIPLDNLTIMAAVISFGLSVDDTIHYFSQLRSALGHSPTTEAIPVAVDRAYRVSAKALMSTTAVMALSFVMLLFSPFRPTASFGLLASVAAVIALAADLVFIPALILRFGSIQKLIFKGSMTKPQRRTGASECS